MNGEFLEIREPVDQFTGNVDFIEVRKPADQVIGAVDGVMEFAFASVLRAIGVNDSAIQGRTDVYAVVPVPEEAVDEDEEIDVDMPVAEVTSDRTGLSQDGAQTVLARVYNIFPVEQADEVFDEAA